jgi:hypothetical protein
VVRPFRYAATVTGVQLVSSWNRIQLALAEARETAQFQLGAEEKKGAKVGCLVCGLVWWDVWGCVGRCCYAGLQDAMAMRSDGAFNACSVAMLVLLVCSICLPHSLMHCCPHPPLLPPPPRSMSLVVRQCCWSAQLVLHPA